MTTCWERAVHSVYRAVFRECVSIWVCVSFPFDFEGWIYELMLMVPDHCLSSYLFFINVLTDMWRISLLAYFRPTCISLLK